MSNDVKKQPLTLGAELTGGGEEPPADGPWEDGATELEGGTAMLPEGVGAVLFPVTLIASFCPKKQWRS